MKIRVFFLLPILLFLSVATLWLTTDILKSNLAAQIATLGVILFIPGFLTTLSLKVVSRNPWVYFLNSLGLSIFWTYCVGLFATYALTQLSIHRPIEGQPLLWTYSGLLVVLTIIAVIRNWSRSIAFREAAISLLSLLLYVLCVAVSIVGLAGAFYLNSGGSYVISLGWFILLAVFLFITAQTRGKVMSYLFPFILFIASLSMLWMYSGRSNYVIGWDIVQEYGVARNTIKRGAWNSFDVKNAYNACLSITLLPAITSNATQLSVDNLYKFVYPFIFAHFPIITYIWLARMSKRVYAFLAVIYMIAQPFFTQTMTGLARQEIAFIFFALALLAVFSKTFVGKSKIFLILIYLAGLVLSHYSSTYMSIALLGIAFSGVSALFILRRFPMPALVKQLNFYQNWFAGYKSDLKWWILPSLLFFSYIWFFVVTQVGASMISTINASFQNFADMLNGKSQSQEVQSAVPGGANSLYTSSVDLSYYEHIHDLVLHNIPQNKIDEIFAKYPLVPFGEALIAPKIDSVYAANANKILVYFKDGLKILLILGAVFQIVRTFRKSDQNLDMVMLSAAGVSIIAVMILHPTIGLQYNISRVFTQLLVVVSLSLVISLDAILFLLPRSARVLLISCVMVVAMLYLHGATVPVLGGVPMLHFYNIGTEYEKSYVFRGELRAARWLQENRNTQNTVYGDDFSGLRLVKEVSFFPNTMIIPVVLENNSSGYVYVSNTNKNLGITRVNFGKKQLTYEFPNQYLDDDRNQIYSNPNASIFR